MSQGTKGDPNMTTAATAYDNAVNALNTYTRAHDNALKIGNHRMAAHFGRKAIKARRALKAWGEHPALRIAFRRLSNCFVGESMGRPVLFGTDLRALQQKAVDHGFRHLDISACGVHNFGL
jgi:hypothetical protein